MTMEGNATLLRWKEWIPSLRELTLKWREVRLEGLQDDSPFNCTLANHEELNLGRERVRSSTRVFSRLDNEGKLNGFSALLKEYQTYIDRLTLSLKHVERFYVELFTGVKSMINPYPFLKILSEEKGGLAELLQRAEACDALEEKVCFLQEELQGLRDQELTIQRLCRQLEEAKRNAVFHADRSAHDLAKEFQHLLLQSQQRNHEMQQEIRSLQYDVFNKDLSIQDYRNHVVDLRASLEALEAQRVQDVAELATELEVSQSNLLKKDAELQHLLSSIGSRVEHVEVKFADVAPAGAGLLETSSLNGKGGDVAHVSNQRIKNIPSQGPPEDARAIWESERQQLLQREETLRGELAALRQRYDELSMSSEAKLREQKEEYQRELAHVQELQQRLQLLGVYVDQLTTDKERLAVAVQTLEGELNNHTKTSSSGGVAGVISSEASYARRENQHPLVREKKDGYSFEKLLSSDATWRGDINPHERENSVDNDDDEGQGMRTGVLATEKMEEKDPFLIVAAQRDKLRGRLLTLNEVSSSQIYSLKLEVANLAAENCTLRQRLADYTGSRDDVYRGSYGAADRGGESFFGIPICTAVTKDDGLEAKTGFPQLVDSVGGMVSRRTALNVLDYGAGVLSMRVFSTTFGRRFFVAYLTFLHFYVLMLCLI